MSEGTPVAHIDATAGVAGDMLLGALLDAGASLDAVRDAVASLGIAGLDLTLHRARRGGLACARVVVTTPESSPARRPADVFALVGAARLSPAGHDWAQRVFERLTSSEAAVHGVDPADVHFHEVGAADALADVVGLATALDDLGLLASDAVVRCSSLAAGSGTIDTDHGLLPIPAPAVLDLAAAAGFTLTGGDLAGERSTPTGVAALATIAVPGPAPDMRVRAVGTGGGSRDRPERPNVTRVVVGSAPDDAVPRRSEPVTVVETTVDDLEPELWPAVLRAVRDAGAWDCWTTPVIARHGRPGQVLTALCAPEARPAVVQTAFRHTASLGVRWSEWARETLPRHSVTITIGPVGAEKEVTVKVAELPDGTRTGKPELTDVERAAEALGWSARAVTRAVLDALATRPE